MKAETWLPGFPGFYGTFYEFKEEDFLYEHGINYDDIEIDHTQYEIDVCTSYAELVESNIPWVKSIKFEKVISPKYYNFRNDSADILVDFDFHAMRRYVYEHRDMFNDYLRGHYTSYDGFMSFYSNTFEEWEEETNKFRDVDSHRIGAIMNFAFEMELEYDKFDDPDTQTYYEVMDDIYPNNYITIIQKAPEDLDDYDAEVVALELVESLEDEPFGYMGVLAEEFKKRAELYGVEWRQLLAEERSLDVLHYMKVTKVNPNTNEVIYAR